MTCEVTATGGSETASIESNLKPRTSAAKKPFQIQTFPRQKE